MAKKVLFFVVATLALLVILLTKLIATRDGMPIIESKIDVQLADLMSNTPALSSYPIGGRERARVVGGRPPFTGKIWYQTRVEGAAADLVVYWEGSSNACQIDKIEVQGTSLSPRVVWQKKFN
jgi:hypothetical protein